MPDIGARASEASIFTNTSAEQHIAQTVSASIAVDAAVRDAIVYLVSNASELVDGTLERLPDVASQVPAAACPRRRARGGVPAAACPRRCVLSN
jgi:hypothetical protein